ncbi:hypothetical protein EYC80_000562 [Monilinia laxa]|uniref:Uncharacterized protein n=1 Tax=Monilinia laxa TaxID=61186 RepID=A0A5N6KB07_MONLA|nr:hypothetical protein EYC80_000562 [Monilinia laxa]
MADHLTDTAGTHDVEAAHHKPAILGEGRMSEENTQAVPENGETCRDSDLSNSQGSSEAREEIDYETRSIDRSINRPQGADLSEADSHGRTALFFAVIYGMVDAMRAITPKYPESVNSQDKYKTTPLDLAALRGSLETVELLLVNNANNANNPSIDFQDVYGNTALCIAARNVPDDSVEIVKHLLAKNAKIDLQDNDGFTALTLATYFRNTEALQVLLKNNANIDLRNNDGHSAMQIASHSYFNVLSPMNDFKAIINRLPMAMSLQDRKDELMRIRALEWAAYVADHVVVWWILVSGSKEEIDIHGKRALELAIKQNGKKENKQNDYSLTIDILKDPPLVQGWSEPDDPYRYPRLSNMSKRSSENFNGPSEKLLQDFKGTIVDFYRHEKSTRVDFLRRSRTVWDIIYGKPKESGNEKSQDECSTSGPAMIMKESGGKLKEIDLSSEVAKQESYSEKDLQLRWVHLPANNTNEEMKLFMTFKEKIDDKVKQQYDDHGISNEAKPKLEDQRSGLPRLKETERWKVPGLAIKSVLEMDKLTQRIQDLVNSVLSIEQNEANLSEAEVFLPMSFLASLFALDVKSFSHENGNLIYTFGFIFSIIFGATDAISIPAII